MIAAVYERVFGDVFGTALAYAKNQVVVEGSLRTKSYERDGQKHYRTEVNATKLEVASGVATLG